MGTITEQLTDSEIVAEDLSLDDPTAIQFCGKRNVFMSAGDALWESKLLEELINDADSRIDALVYFFFGSEGERHVSSITSAAIPKLTH